MDACASGVPGIGTAGLAGVGVTEGLGALVPTVTGVGAGEGSGVACGGGVGAKAVGKSGDSVSHANTPDKASATTSNAPRTCCVNLLHSMRLTSVGTRGWDTCMTDHVGG